MLIAISSFVCSAKEEVKVLYIGGTHSLGLFGKELDGRLRLAGVDLTTVIDGESGPYHWLKAYQPFSSSKGHWYKDSVTERRLESQRSVTKLETLIEFINPSHVIIQAEWNLFGTLRSPRRDKADNVAELRFLISQVCQVVEDGGAKAYWVLPPDSHEKRYSRELQHELAEIMIEVISGFDFDYFESARSTQYLGNFPITDGVTLTDDQYQSWSIAVTRDLLNILPKIPNKHKTEPKLISQPIPVSTPLLDPIGDELVEELTAKK